MQVWRWICPSVLKKDHRPTIILKSSHSIIFDRDWANGKEGMDQRSTRE